MKGKNEVGNLREFGVNLISNGVWEIPWNVLSSQKFDHEIWEAK